MFKINFDEIKIFDDKLSELDILKKLIEQKGDEEPFHMLDVADIIKKHQQWIKKMPNIVPYYAVKCNPHPTVLKLIATLGGNFDCASKGEIIQVMRYGVSSDRIIFASPMKLPCHLEHAKKVGVAMMTVDNECELFKIKKIYPEAKIIIRIRWDANKVAENGILLGDKFGCDPNVEAMKLIKATINLGLELYGFSFHVGSPCDEPIVIINGIFICKNLIEIAKSLGCKNVNIIDIGGGFPGHRTFNLDKFSDVINHALIGLDPSIQVIAEPGRYYVTSAFTSAVSVIGKKSIINNGEQCFMYYLSDGTYGSFLEEMLQLRARRPVALDKPMPNRNEKMYKSTLWGPTCDSCDFILKETLLPEFNIGDWLIWSDVGAYTTSSASEFNGFSVPKIYPIMRRKDWDLMCIEINKKKDLHMLPHFT